MSLSRGAFPQLLTQLLDVDAGSPDDGDVLEYDLGSGDWKNGPNGGSQPDDATVTLNGSSKLQVPSLLGAADANLLDHGGVADWNGSSGTDNLPAIIAALEALASSEAAVKRLYIPKGDYWVDGGGSPMSTVSVIEAALDNLTIEWHPAAMLHFTNTSQGPLGIHGCTKVGTYSVANYYENQTVIPITGPSVGDMAVVCSNSDDVTALGLEAGDYILIRTGQLISGQTNINPDSELLQIESVDGDGVTLHLMAPVQKSYAQEYFPTPGTPTSLSADADGGATSITVASISGFAANDYITIGDPSHDGYYHATQVSGTPSGSTINLKSAIATGITIPSGATVHKASGGPTTTSSTTAPAAFGIAKVTATTVSNVTLINPRISAPLSPGNQFEQIDGLTIVDGDQYLKGGAAVCNNVRRVRITRPRISHPSTNANNYSISFGRGSSDIEIADQDIRGALHAGVTFSEGTVCFRLHGGAIRKANQSASGRQLVAVQSRAGYASILGVDLEGGPTDYAVGVEINCPRGGVIDDCTIRTTATNAGYIKSAGWTWGRGNIMLGSTVAVRSDSTSSLLHLTGAGSPNGVYTAPIGSTYCRTDGGSNTTWYVKTSGTGNSGWSALLDTVAGGSGFTTEAVATTDQSLSSTTTMTDDADLLFAIGSSSTEVWFFEAFMLMAALDTSAGCKFSCVGPSGASAAWGLGGGAAGTGKAGFNPTSGAVALLALGGSTGSLPSVNGALGYYLSGWVFGGGTAGNFNMQFAPNASDSNALTRKTGSYIRAQKLIS